MDPAPLVEKPRKSFFHHAATVSVWMILPPFVIQFLMAGIYQAMERNALDVVLRLGSVVLIVGSFLLGIVAGIVALFGISKHGRNGILVKALFGILVPILLVLISLPTALRASEYAAKMRMQQQTERTKLSPEN